MKAILKLAILTTLLSFFVYGCSPTDEEATEADSSSSVATDVEDGESADMPDDADHADLGTNDDDMMDLAVFQNNDGEIICPVAGDVTSVEDAVGFQDYDGTRYYFCCDECPESFAADPAKYAID